MTLMDARRALCSLPGSLAVLLSLGMAGSSARAAAPLNDTGITFSTSSIGVTRTTCVVISDGTGQDCNHGRDAAAAAGTLQKIGGSAPNKGIANGFDFTKISNSGNPLPEGAALGYGPDDWACTRDNVTGLTWEVKVADQSMRDKNWRYSWYDPNSPDGFPGYKNLGVCATGERCDTEAYAASVNALALCGATDWRLPSIAELTNIIDFGRLDPAPAIDPTYFPNSATTYGYWSASPYAADSGYAWAVLLVPYVVNLTSTKFGAVGVRLVRGGQ